jgi:ribose transport system substrate-binding protein
MRWCSYLLLFFGLTGIILNCSKTTENQYSKTIGVSLLTRAHVFYRDLEEGLRVSAQQYGYELILNAAEWDANRQISQIEDFVTRKVDAIIVAPVDSRGVGNGILAANKAAIPVFTADIASFEGEVICHVASDNLAGGRLAGEYLVKLLGGKGKIAIINQPIVTSTLDRVQGFREIIQKYPEIEVVADMNGDGVRDRAMQVATDILQAHPQLDGIFAINDDSALGTLDAIEDFNRENIVMVGYDATPPARDAILRGSALKADVIQYPYNIGTKTVEMIAQYFSGNPVPNTFPIEVGIVDREILLQKSEP